jgi:hypothetical protein
MEPRLMKESLEDYTRIIRGRYSRRPGKQARSLLLNEYCKTTGLERKYAIKVLRGQRRKPPGDTVRGTTSTYTPADIALLKGLWLAAGQPCGKRLAGAMLKLWLASWEKHHGKLEEPQRKRLEGISAAQIDRELGPYRTAGRKRRIASSALAAMQREIAVRCEPWAETAPGALEIDTVALCGGSLSGAIIWALDATDIHSGWTEVRAVWNRGGHATRERVSEIEKALPFVLRKLDFDNGTEFLNAHFVSHFKVHEPKVELSRSRPYRKNDNAHIEQKNYTHVRLLLGDDRFEHQELVEPLNTVLAEWSLWNNLYGAQRRLLSKDKQPDGKVKRQHEKQAATPCARLLERKDLSPEQRGRLEALLAANDPIGMRQRIEQQLKALYSLRAQLKQEEEEPPEAVPGGEKATPPVPASVRGRACATVAKSPPAPVAPCATARPRTEKKSAEEHLQRSPQRAKKQPPTVSTPVRHRATS